jgi:hypothetical protein
MTDQAIEIIARGIDPQAWADELPVPTRACTIAFHMGRAKSIAQAQAALTALADAGMVVVPVVPSEVMIEAALFANENALLPMASCNDIRNAYTAMVAAALPTPPIQAGRG